MKYEPRVSILTPSFNQGHWLQDNLDSVTRQTYKSVEHIVMDGGSSDETLAVLQNARSHVTFKSEKDKGQSDALNKAFLASNGEFIGWLNSDDCYVDQRAIETAVRYFQSHADVDVVYGDSLLIGPNNEVLKYLRSIAYPTPPLDLLTPFFQPSVFIRRSALNKTLVQEELHYVMDLDLWRRLAVTSKFARIPLTVAADRHQPNRKVLQSGYKDEQAAYNMTFGFDPNSTTRRLSRSLLKARIRLLGAIAFQRLESTLEPAIDLKVPARIERARLQLFASRASIKPETMKFIPLMSRQQG